MTDEPLIPEVLDPLPTLTPRQIEVIQWRAEGFSYTEIQTETGMDRTTAWRLFHREDARDELRRRRRTAVEALEDGSAQMVAAIMNVVEGAPDEDGKPQVDAVARSIAASHGLKALASLQRADAASRVADVEEKRSLSPDEAITRRAALIDTVRLRLAGGES